MRARHPRSASAQSLGVAPVGNNQTLDRAVVETLTLKAEAVVALSVTVAGTEHVAPVGAPEQVSVALPAVPAPPMVRA